jgi:hypothetical protein
MTLVRATAAQASDPLERPGKGVVKLPVLLSGKPVKTDPGEDELRKLVKARYNEALGEAKGIYEQYLDGRAEWEGVLSSCQRVVQAGLELCDKPADKVDVLTKYLEVTKEGERVTQRRYDAGREWISAVHRARYERLNAEIQLRRAKREADKARDK